MRYEGKRYKLIKGGNDSCSGCVFAEVACKIPFEAFIQQGGQNCNEDFESYYVEDTTPIKKHNRKKLKFNNK